jgi:hypothetical protein
MIRDTQIFEEEEIMKMTVKEVIEKIKESKSYRKFSFMKMLYNFTSLLDADCNGSQHLYRNVMQKADIPMQETWKSYFKDWIKPSVT